MKQFIADYLTFTKKERKGIVVLLIIIVLLLIAPYFLPYFQKNKSATVTTDLQNLLANLEIEKDTGLPQRNYNRRNYVQKDFDENRFVDYSPKWKNYAANFTGTLFEFDPNTLDAAGWEKLGVKEKTAATIQNYISKGGQFKQPEDITKIYGLSDEMVERLLPYVRIEGSSQMSQSGQVGQNSQMSQGSQMSQNSQMGQVGNDGNRQSFVANTSTAKATTNFLIDINTADTIAFKKLPGIGSKLSARIIVYRNKLGGFQTVAQLGETYGLADSTFQKIKGNLVCNGNGIVKININTANEEQLRHPYISKNIANNIIQYRNQHGKYAQLIDLKKLALIDEESFNKMAPYLTTE
jgi:competence protein ComEA